MAPTDEHPREIRFAEFRFYEELNDFLPAKQRKTNFRSPFCDNPSVKDAIQAMSVPHTAIDMILVDGQSVDFSHRLRGGERVAVYPMFERLDISPLTCLHTRPLRCTRFILAAYLGKLARYLRMLGFDAAYQRDQDDSRIIDIALQQHRVILTRDSGILKQNRVTHGYLLRHDNPRQQLQEVLLELDLFRQLQPFTRCMDCNGRIFLVDKPVIRGQISPSTYQRFRKFWQCRDCMNIHWGGSHDECMFRLVNGLQRSARAETRTTR